MDNRIYVANIEYKASEDDLKKYFEVYGNVVSVKILVDKVTGRPRGFGFIDFESANMAEAAIAEANNQEFMGRPLVVRKAQENMRKPSQGGYNRNGGFSAGSGHYGNSNRNGYGGYNNNHGSHGGYGGHRPGGRVGRKVYDSLTSF